MERMTLQGLQVLMNFFLGKYDQANIMQKLVIIFSISYVYIRNINSTNVAWFTCFCVSPFRIMWAYTRSSMDSY